MNENLIEKVKAILETLGEKYVTSSGDFITSKIREDLENLDEILVSKLLEDPQLKSDFTRSVAETILFDGKKLAEMLSYETYWQGSYTKYANKIGLTSGGKYLDENLDVVLDFPYKDTILTANMSKESEKLKELRDEPFLNEIVAKSEIDVLLDKKILVNSKRYDKEHLNGSKATDFDENTDNLIIKGNNLLALHTLKEKYAGKVKLIYLDPPYNTGNDSFLYNDRFNHSTWLTFMKNRLEIAKELLAEDGSIFVHLDKNEVHYLAILMNEIFGKNNYIETITIVNNPRGRDYGGIANVNEFILVYRKSEQTSLNLIADTDKKFKYKDELGGFDILELRNRNSAFHKQNRPNLWYPVFINPTEVDDNGFLAISLEKSDEYSIELPPRKSQQGVELVWRWGKDLLRENLNINAVAKLNSDGTYSLMQKYRKNETMARSIWQGTDYNSFERGTNHLKELFEGEKVFSFPKPESTLKTVIEIGSKEGDIVLDFFAGSATTLAAAMKMNRRFIGIEQMDYINTVSVERLKKVIEGEQGGISKTVNWQGGGSFVYAELVEKNTGFIREIANAETIPQLQEIYNRMQERGDIDFRVNDELLSENLASLKDDLGENLKFEEIQKLLIRIIDKNQLYYNYSEFGDRQVRDLLSEEDVEFNLGFYGE